MVVTDPIADALTIMRNGISRKKKVVEVKSSKFIEEIVKLLLENGYIENYKHVPYKNQGLLRVYLKYLENGLPGILGLKRISTPGLRRYVAYTNVPRVLNGLGNAIISTPKGLMIDRQARKLKIGGEIILYVW